MTTILETMSEPALQAPKFIPVEKIDHDRNWNSRKYIGDDGNGGSPEEHSFEELLSSIREDGQDTPIEVKVGSDGHYFLISGFRRFSAFRRIYADGGQVKGVPPGHIKAYVHEGLSELDALIRNGRENTGRKGLNMADTAYLIHRLAQHGLSDTQIADRLALAPPYVNSLHIVYKRGSELRVNVGDRPMTVFDHWRESPGRVGFQNLLDLVRTDVDPRIKEMKYLEMLNAPKVKPGPKPQQKPLIPKSDIQTAEYFGLLMGRAERSGCISVNKPDWPKLLEVCKNMKLAKAAPEHVKNLTEAAQRGYQRGLL
jgi:hypothetical protein